MSETNQPPKLNSIERFLIWLSAADSDILRDHCPKWERLKYAAFGASLLVPFLFGMIASSYAVSTLTDNTYIIAGFSVVWGFIIITIDRVLLATYRAFISLQKKLLQFALRVTVAVLMGLTVSHPLTLMLFQDAINSEIERVRMEEMAEARGATDAQKKEVNDRIAKATENLQGLQARYQEVIGGNFLNSQPAQTQVTPEATTRNSQFADIDNLISEIKRERDQVQTDLNRWQKVYDDEISGARTGKPGIGPNARAIERDELVWRREEVRRLNGVIAERTKERADLSSKLLAESAAANAKIEASRREFEQQKIDMFKQQQGELLAGLKGQIESANEELKRLRSESEQITDNTIERVDNLKGEKRTDLMVQTVVLHHLFEKEGGGFALAVYIVITALFTLIDTIPLVVKFFAEPGIYDHYQEAKERRSGDVVSERRLDSSHAWISNEAGDWHQTKQLTRQRSEEATEQDFILSEIGARAMKKLLDNDLSEDEMNEVRHLIKKQREFVDEIQQYAPIDPTKVAQKRLPYHPEFEEFDTAEGKRSKRKQDREGVEPEQKAKQEPPIVVSPAASNVIPFEPGVDESVPEPRQPKQTVPGKPGEAKRVKNNSGNVIANANGQKTNGKRVNGSSTNGAQKRRSHEIPLNPAMTKELASQGDKSSTSARPAAASRVQQAAAQQNRSVVAESTKTPAKAAKTAVHKPITGSINIPKPAPKKKAQPVPPKPIEGTIDFSNIQLAETTQPKTQPQPKPNNDFVEAPADNDLGGFGSMLLKDSGGEPTTAGVPAGSLRRKMTPGGIAMPPANEKSHKPEDAV